VTGQTSFHASNCAAVTGAARGTGVAAGAVTTTPRSASAAQSGAGSGHVATGASSTCSVSADAAAASVGGCRRSRFRCGHASSGHRVASALCDAVSLCDDRRHTPAHVLGRGGSRLWLQVRRPKELCVT
jgi:hypothetical protein